MRVIVTLARQAAEAIYSGRPLPELFGENYHADRKSLGGIGETVPVARSGSSDFSGSRYCLSL